MNIPEIRKNIYRRLSVEDKIKLTEVMDDRLLWKSIVNDLSKVYVIYTKDSNMSPEISRFKQIIDEKQMKVYGYGSVIKEYDMIESITQDNQRFIYVSYFYKDNILDHVCQTFTPISISSCNNQLHSSIGGVDVCNKIIYDMDKYRLEFNGKEIQSGRTYREIGVEYNGVILVYKR